MAAWWVRIDLLQNYFAIRNVCLRRWQIILTGFSAESIVMPDPTTDDPTTDALSPVKVRITVEKVFHRLCQHRPRHRAAGPL